MFNRLQREDQRIHGWMEKERSKDEEQSSKT